jgi:hypothetical protein
MVTALRPVCRHSSSLPCAGPSEDLPVPSSLPARAPPAAITLPCHGDTCGTWAPQPPLARTVQRAGRHPPGAPRHSTTHRPQAPSPHCRIHQHTVLRVYSSPVPRLSPTPVTSYFFMLPNSEGLMNRQYGSFTPRASISRTALAYRVPQRNVWPWWGSQGAASSRTHIITRSVHALARASSAPPLPSAQLSLRAAPFWTSC